MNKIKIKITADQLITVEELLQKAPPFQGDETSEGRAIASVLLQVFKQMSKRKIDRLGNTDSKKKIAFSFEYYEAYRLSEFCQDNAFFFENDYQNHQVFKTYTQLNQLLA